MFNMENQFLLENNFNAMKKLEEHFVKNGVKSIWEGFSSESLIIFLLKMLNNYINNNYNKSLISLCNIYATTNFNNEIERHPIS